MRNLTTLLAAFCLLILFIGCGSDGKPAHEFAPVPSPGLLPKDGPGGAPSPPSRDQQLADAAELIANPHAEVAEKDGEGKPTIYYGRIFFRTEDQGRALEALFFRLVDRPYFDEFAWTRSNRTPEGPEGVWRYAIATGVQWNLVLKNPVLLGVAEINPRWDKRSTIKTAHPSLESFTEGQAFGQLNARKLAEAGFQFELPKTSRPTGLCADPSKLGTKGFWGDAWDTVVLVAGAVASGVADILRGVGKNISEVIQKAANGIVEAIDLLRELGNEGVCALTGKFTVTGIAYVQTPEIVERRYPAHVPPQFEPIRYGVPFARGGPGGILLAEGTINALSGVWKFDNLCKGLYYSVVISTKAGPAWVTDNGVWVSSVDITGLNDVYNGIEHKEYRVGNSDKVGLAFIGAQLAREVAVNEFGFEPRPPKVAVAGATTLVTGVTDTSVTLCGAGNLVTGLTTIFAGGAVLTPQLDKDIYISDDGFAKPDPVGEIIHEYAHYTQCEIIRQRAGEDALKNFLNKYSWMVLSSGSNDEQLKTPIRNSAEGFADYFAYTARGYTDYFLNDRSTSAATRQCYLPTRVCLESDATFQANVTTKEDIASRVSVMYDWTDVSSTGYRMYSGIKDDDDKLSLPTNSIAYAMGIAGSEPTTHRMASAMSMKDEYGRPGEELCQIFKRHGWGCDALGGGAALLAPDDFDGIAISTDKIRWSWTPRDSLATKQVVVNATSTGFVDVADVPLGTFVYEQTVPGGPNTAVVAAVEARRNEPPIASVPGRSARAKRCTKAAQVTLLRAEVTGAVVHVSWTAVAASDYVIERWTGSGAPVQVAVVSKNPFGDPFFDDVEAGPGIPWTYRVQSRNCDGVRTAGAEAYVTIPFDDPSFIYVSATAAPGGDGSRAKPLTKIADALALVSATRTRILLAAGNYNERVYASKAVAIVGGYNSDFTERDLAKHRSIIVGDDSTWTFRIGSAEFGHRGQPLVAFVEDGLLDGVYLVGHRKSKPIPCVRPRSQPALSREGGSSRLLAPA